MNIYLKLGMRLAERLHRPDLSFPVYEATPKGYLCIRVGNEFYHWKIS